MRIQVSGAGAGLIAVATVSLLAACSTPATREAPTATTSVPAATGSAHEATVNLSSASASLVSGKLTLTVTPQGIRAQGGIGGLAPGSTHGFHVHERGDCSAVDASSAGGHFNPAGSAHGRAGTATHHAGDIDNIVAGSDGVAQVDVLLAGVTLGGGGTNDIAGKAFIVHAAPDDYTSQPAGNAGARVACGLIQVVR